MEAVFYSEEGNMKAVAVPASPPAASSRSRGGGGGGGVVEDGEPLQPLASNQPTNHHNQFNSEERIAWDEVEALDASLQ